MRVGGLGRRKRPFRALHDERRPHHGLRLHLHGQRGRRLVRRRRLHVERHLRHARRPHHGQHGAQRLRGRGRLQGAFHPFRHGLRHEQRGRYRQRHLVLGGWRSHRLSLHRGALDGSRHGLRAAHRRREQRKGPAVGVLRRAARRLHAGTRRHARPREPVRAGLPGLRRERLRAKRLYRRRACPFQPPAQRPLQAPYRPPRQPPLRRLAHRVDGPAGGRRRGGDLPRLRSAQTPRGFKQLDAHPAERHERPLDRLASGKQPVDAACTCDERDAPP